MVRFQKFDNENIFIFLFECSAHKIHSKSELLHDINEIKEQYSRQNGINHDATKAISSAAKSIITELYKVSKHLIYYDLLKFHFDLIFLQPENEIRNEEKHVAELMKTFGCGVDKSLVFLRQQHKISFKIQFCVLSFQNPRSNSTTDTEETLDPEEHIEIARNPMLRKIDLPLTSRAPTDPRGSKTYI